MANVELLARGNVEGGGAARTMRSLVSALYGTRLQFMAAIPDSSAPCSWTRIRLPAGSRKGQSYAYGCSIGFWAISAPLACRKYRPGRWWSADPAVGALRHHLGDDAALVVGNSGVSWPAARGGWTSRSAGGPTVIQRSLLSDVVADVEAEDVATEGQRCVRVVMREEAR